MLPFIKSFILSLTVSIGVCLVGLHQPTNAVTGSEWKAGNVIDDSRFYVQKDMSTQEIQSFLNSKVPNCDTWGTKMYSATMTRAQYGASKGYPAPYTCVKDYSMPVQGKAADSYCSSISAGTKNSAQIIYEVSGACGISVKALIVMLEKEQGLVSDDWPFSIQYRSAMGYGCPDTAPCDAEYYGFFNQVYNAARQFKLYAASPNSYRYRPYQNNSIYWSPNLACGASNVYIENKATAGLYNYTPYQPNQAALNNLYGTGDGCSAYGNRNFWRLYNDWLGSTSAPFSIIKKSNSSQLYLYDGNIKFLIPTWETYLAYGFDRLTAFTLSDSYIDSLPNGNPLSNLSRSNAGVVYLNAKGKRYALSGQRCVDWGLDCFNPYALNTLSNDALGLTPLSGTVQPLMENNGSVYKMVGGKKQPFLSFAAMAERGYDWSTVTKVENMSAGQTLDILLPHQSAALKFPSSPAIYVYIGDKFYSISSYDSFTDWRIDKIYVNYYPKSTYNTSPPPSTGSISTNISANSRRYIVNNGVKLDITDVASSWPIVNDQSHLQPLLDKLSYQQINSSSTFKSLDGRIFRAENSKSRTFQSLDDFYLLGGGLASPITLSRQNESLLTPGPNLLAPGAPYKKPDGSGRIYVINARDSSLLVPTYELYNQYVLSSYVRSVDSVTAAAYPSTGDISSYFTSQNNSTNILSTQGNVYYSQSSPSTPWNPQASSVTFGVNLASKNRKVTTRFARSNDGRIYYADSGCKRLITSYDTFSRLGGSNDNVMYVFDDFLNSICSGPNI